MTNPRVYSLFVYGSLRKGFPSPMDEFMVRFFEFAGPAKVKGKLFDLGEYPAAVGSEDIEYIVGELYHVRQQNEFSWVIGQLDDYEGVHGDENEQPLYRRALAEVHIGDEVKPAWIYWYTGDVTGRPVVMSGDIIEYMSNK